MTVTDREPNEGSAGSQYLHALVAAGVEWTFDARGDLVVAAMDVQRLAEPAACFELASGAAGSRLHRATAGAASDGN